MRILFLADGRSPIALNWIHHWIERGEEVHLLSSFACEPPAGAASFHVVPVAFSGARRPRRGSPSAGGFLWGVQALQLRQVVRHWLGPLFLPGASRGVAQIIEDIKPDLVHAMRIPYEGMLAAGAVRGVPLVVSVWGNDFTLHARSTPLMAALTRRTMRMASALHSDCQRDVRLAGEWGFHSGLAVLVAPGNGGVHSGIFHPPPVPAAEPVIVNPRGFRGYVRQDTFFRSVPLVLKKLPLARFTCSSMAGEKGAIKWIERLGIADAVTLLPPVPHQRMGDIFRSAAVVVSPSVHDGTPNSLLEAMACGCFPVAGDLESLREWITPGRNGFLINPASPEELASAVIKSLSDAELRQRAALKNKHIIAGRADFEHCMKQAETFYRQVLAG